MKTRSTIMRVREHAPDSSTGAGLVQREGHVIVRLGLAALALLAAAPVNSPWARPAASQDDDADSVPQAETLGHAPEWGASMTAGTFSLANLANGSLSTGLPLVVHLQGLGPAANVVLFHHSGALARGESSEFPLGDGWSVEALSTLDVEQQHVTFGNGARVHFVNGQSSPGYFLELSQIGADRWRVSNGRGELIYELGDDGSSRARLVEVRDVVGNTLTIEYAASGLLSRMVEANGRSVSFYDANSDGRIESIVDDSDPATGTISLTYTAGRLTAFADAGGSGTQLDYDSKGRIAWIEDGYLDGTGLPNRWTYGYDGSGRLQTVSDPAPRTSATTLAYTPGLTKVTSRTGTKLEYEFDALGRLVRAGYPLMGDSTYAYNASNQRTKMTNAEGHIWRAEFDVEGQMTKITDASGLVTEFVYDGLGRMTSMSDATGPDVTFGYNDADFPTLITDIVLPPDGQGLPAATTKIAYLGSASGTPGLIDTVTDPNGVVTRCTYGPFGIVDEVISGDGFARSVRLRSHYDNAGVMHTSTTFTPDSGAQDPAGFPSLPAAHPALVGLPVRTQLTQLGWDGQGTSVSASYTSGVHPLGAPSSEFTAAIQRQATFDYLGRPLSSSTTDDQATVDLGLPPVMRAASTVYHDAPAPGFPNGGRVELESSSVSRSIVYDALGRPESVSSSDGLDTTYDYYPDGALRAMTLDTGSSLSRFWYEYAPNNRPSRMKVQYSTDGVTWTEQRRIDWIYGAAGLLQYSLEYHFGALMAGTSYVYDAREQLLWEKRLGHNPYNRVYTYDQGGNRTAMLVLDSSDQVQEHHTYVYDVDDTAQFHSKANRLMEEFHFDGAGALLRQKWYYYDDTFGNVREVVVKQAADAWHNGVRLVYLDRPGAELQSTVAIVLEHRWIADAQGVEVPGTHTWLRARELRQEGVLDRYQFMERDPQTLAPILNPDSRIWTDGSANSGGPSSDFAVDSASGVVSELRTLLSTLGQTEGGSQTWFATDLVGNTRWWLNASGVYHDEVATAYGERISTGVPFASRYGGFLGGYGGEEDLLPLGWKRIGARLYDPAAGRWLQRDPIGIGGGINEYEYSANNPVMRCDPSGLQAPNTGVGLSAGQTVTFSNGNGSFTVTVLPKPDGGETPAPVDLGEFPGSQGPPGLPAPASPPGGNPPPGWPAGLPYPPTGMPPVPLPPGPQPPSNGPAPAPLPEPEYTWWQRAILAFLRGATRTRETTPGARQAFQSMVTPPAGWSPPWGGATTVKPGCFTGETLVHTPEGARRIDAFAVGDAITTISPEGLVSTSVVEAVEVHPGPNLVCDLLLGDEAIVSMPGHVILTREGWLSLPLMADSLDVVCVDAGLRDAVARNPRRVEATVYNLRVRDGDVYLIGEAGLVVREH